MIWLALVLMAAAAMAPLALSLNRDAAARNRRDAAVALHRAQLVELDRDLAARQHGFLYGLAAVFLSLGLGWAAAIAFKRRA